MPQRQRNSTLRLLAFLGLGCTLGAALPDVPTPDNFLRRSWATATVLGDYVYIDGGEISQMVDGESRGADVVNSTLSIDVSKSWKSLEVTIRTIPKPGPAKTNVGLWTDTTAGAFYSWGGRWPGGKNITKSALWKFTADGKGGGSWAVEEPGNPTLFSGMHQTEYGAFVSTDTTGFVIGGAAHAWTEMDHYTADPIPGMVAFDMKSKIWQNGTTNFSPFDSGVLNKASAVYLPAIGPNGLIITLGGYAPPVDSDLNKSDGSPLDLRNLTLFNPETKKKYWQTTTGTVPPSPRGQFCTAAFPTSDGGYDVFIFGGINGRDQFDHGDAYVLSMPGFVWTKLPDPPGGKRTGASCVRVGKRQVLTIGGTDGSASEADPAPQGLLLFDMTAMEWKDSYDATAAAYERSETVKKWYDENDLEKVDWSSDEFQKLFVAASASATATNTDPTSTPPPTGGAPGSTSTSDPETESSPTPVGAIVGGVVGGIAGLAAIGVAAWFILRRRKQEPTPENQPDPARPSELDPNQQQPHHHQQYPHGHAIELDPNSPYSQNTTYAGGYTPNMAMDGYYGYKEKEGSVGPPPVELGHGMRPSELGAGINHYELDSTPLR